MCQLLTPYFIEIFDRIVYSILNYKGRDDSIGSIDVFSSAFLKYYNSASFISISAAIALEIIILKSIRRLINFNLVTFIVDGVLVLVHYQ